MSVIEGKVWGSTEPIIQSPSIELHRIKVSFFSPIIRVIIIMLRYPFAPPILLL